MAKNFKNEDLFEEEFIEEVEENKMNEKKSLVSKIKETASKVGDLTLRDVGKGAFKVGAAIGGVGLVVLGTVKLLGKSDDDIDIVDILDDDGNLVGFEVTDAKEVEATEE